jgi:hypothetical protein
MPARRFSPPWSAAIIRQDSSRISSAMLASTIAANLDRIDRGSGLLKRFPGHLVNLDRPALRSCSARRIRRVVSAIDLSSQPTSSPFFILLLCGLRKLTREIENLAIGYFCIAN